jgi:serine/threonine protein kinase/Tol biopolymer transport system component
MTEDERTDRWPTIERLYLAALERAPVERHAFLEEACAGDAALRREIESLLRFEGAAEAFIEEPAVAMIAADVTAAHQACPAAGLIGQNIGDYHVMARIGRGGMGEVYRAHDTRLGRDVAIKVLPADSSPDADRLWRLQREARLLASLNHPNIGAIYGLEGTAAAPALVLELIEGATLGDLIARTSGRGMKIAEALPIARQIAGALEAAHEKGVIHRDLKPANVKLTADGTVKVLDFGVAKLSGQHDEGDRAENVLQGSATRHGVIVGTPSYMSPEQARGESVDKRCDIWAFGCVLFEMLTGRAVFEGATTADTLAAVLEREPDWTSLPASTPPEIRRLLARCLERSPKRRLRDIGDAHLELEDDSHAPSMEPRANRRRAIPWLLTGAGASLLIISGMLWERPAPIPQRVEFALDPPVGHALVDVPVPSPDGSRVLVLARASSGETSLWVRNIEASSLRRIPGTENAAFPFWAPDGQSIGFAIAGMLKRTTLSGNAIQNITPVDPYPLGATWNRGDVIVFTPTNKTPLYRVQAGGTGLAQLTSLNLERRENSHRWPHFLPDGRRFLFTARSDVPEYTGIYIASLDSADAPKWIMSAQSSAAYLPSGHLVYMRDNTLVAQRFDPEAGELSGEPVVIAGDVRQETPAASGKFSVSSDGRVLTYSESGGNRLAWFDRSGRETPIAGARGDFSQIQLSPDGSRAAVVIPDRQNGNRDIWLVTLADGGLTRLTSDPTHDWFPVWSPDGGEIIFASDRHGRVSFYRTSTTGATREERLFLAPSSGGFFPTDWSKDGSTVAFHSYPRGDVSLLPLAPNSAPTLLVESPFTDWVAAISPDGKWAAYVSDESGSEQIYVTPMRTRGKHRISVNGGMHARWRRDGGELFFLGPRNELMSVNVGFGWPVTPSPPVQLFEGCRVARRFAYEYLYDVAPDGRTVWICPADDSDSAIVAVNWATGLPRR